MIKRNWPIIYTIYLIVSDYFLLNLSLIISLYLIFDSHAYINVYLRAFIFINITFFPLAVFNGMYRDIFNLALNIQKRDLKNISIQFGLLFMSYIFISKAHQYSRAVVIIFLIIQFILLSLNRSILYRIRKYLLRKGYGLKRGIIIGTGKTAFDFYNDVEKYFKHSVKIEGLIANGEEPQFQRYADIKILGSERNLVEIVQKLEVDYIFIVKEVLSDEIEKYIRILSYNQVVHVKVITPRTRVLMKLMKIRDISGIPLTFDKSRYRYIFINDFLKRWLDLFLASCLSIIFFPFGIIIAIVIKITSKGPIIFKQQRSLSKEGKSFEFYKFRTMYCGADQEKHELIQKNESDGALFKIKNDFRITPVGKILRNFSLDEIPQLVNVLRGDMSFVGPRPLPVDDYNMLQNRDESFDWYKLRENTKPGITGLWQISGRSNLSFEEMCLLDLYYIENKTILFDLEILFETIPVIIFGKGAY